MEQICRGHTMRRWVVQIFRRQPPATPTSINLTTPPVPLMTHNTKLPPPPAQVFPTCDICTDPEISAGPLKSICRSCTTQYCQKCIRELFLRAIKSPTNMPAKCCEMIPIHVGSKLMSKEEAIEYRTKFEEWRTDAKDRVYCPRPTCSVFIPLKQLRAAGKIPDETNAKEKRDSKDPVPSLEELAATPSIDCPKCTTVICVACKSFAHPMEPCKGETQNDEMLALLAKWGYKRCPRCGHGTRKMFGCSHMQCICGAHWCWGCERNFNECERQGGCEWDEDDDEEMGYDSMDEGSDEEATVAEVEMMDAGPEHTGDTSAEEPTESQQPPGPVVMGPMTEQEARRQRRAENLDARPGRYWEQQDLYFGSEPGDAEDGVWECEHRWTLRAEDAKVWDGEGMECHQCWTSIPNKGQAWFCDWCGLLGCGKCTEKDEEKAEDKAVGEGSSS